ncbi:kinase-like domain-containing protein [Mycena pura]|uniref:Kinase-like domain-containing protein n=1 Tax=Mycena pura TaxID=153505 RepID=A0AAD6Y844_9AGAR|nr:kinase-like domain-containing protein [Mycena pura]
MECPQWRPSATFQNSVEFRATRVSVCQPPLSILALYVHLLSSLLSTSALQSAFRKSALKSALYIHLLSSLLSTAICSPVCFLHRSALKTALLALNTSNVAVPALSRSTDQEKPTTGQVPVSDSHVKGPDTKTQRLDDFDILHRIGWGATSTVYLVRERATGNLYALKQALKHSSNGDVAEEQRTLRHLAETPDPWCGGKDLSVLLANRQFLAKKRVKAYMAQLIVAVEALHDQRIIHRDIKPDNIFVTNDGNLVLGDFGCAKRFKSTLMNGLGYEEPVECSLEIDDASSHGSFFKLPEDDVACVTRDRCGTLYYMSPAQHAGTEYSFDADIWALGLVFFKMSTGRLPFGENAEGVSAIHVAYAEDPIVITTADEFDVLGLHLIQAMLVKDGKERLTIKGVKAHPYFSGVDWDAVARHKAPVPWVPKVPEVPQEPRKNMISPGSPCVSGVDSFDFVSPRFSKQSPFKSFFQRIIKTFGSKKAKVQRTLPVPRISFEQKPVVAPPPPARLSRGRGKHVLRPDEVEKFHAFRYPQPSVKASKAEPESLVLPLHQDYEHKTSSRLSRIDSGMSSQPQRAHRSSCNQKSLGVRVKLALGSRSGPVSGDSDEKCFLEVHGTLDGSRFGVLPSTTCKPLWRSLVVFLASLFRRSRRQPPVLQRHNLGLPPPAKQRGKPPFNYGMEAFCRGPGLGQHSFDPGLRQRIMAWVSRRFRSKVKHVVRSEFVLRSW